VGIIKAKDRTAIKFILVVVVCALLLIYGVEVT